MDSRSNVPVRHRSAHTTETYDPERLSMLLPRLTLDNALPTSSNTSQTMSPPNNICLTDTDITRRNLAATGLNVSAPEFVPSFLATSAISCTPSVTPPSQPDGLLRSNDPVTLDDSASDIHPRFQNLSADCIRTTFIPPVHPLSPPDQFTPPPPLPQPDVYSNVTELLPETPLLSIGPHISTPPFHSHSSFLHPDQHTARAVDSFNAHFPALNSSTPQRVADDDACRASFTDYSLPEWGDSSDNHSDAVPPPKVLGWGLLHQRIAEKERIDDTDRQLDMLGMSLARAQLTRRDTLDSADWDDCHWSDNGATPSIDSPTFAPPPLLGVHGVHGFSVDIGSVWVPTGQSVGALYDSLRSEAAEKACLRNKYYDRATGAFKKGDGASARKWSALGKMANDQMKELHRKAADAIFEARNRPGCTDVIDLHGLHVAEAVERLPMALEKVQSGKVRVVTGSGHHTRGTGRARLRPAVKKWLQENGFYFEEVVDANDFVGSFVVDLDKR